MCRTICLWCPLPSTPAHNLQACADALLRYDPTQLCKAQSDGQIFIRDSGAAPHLVNLLKAKGSNDLIVEAAAMLNVLPEFVAAHYEHFERHLVAGGKRGRDREIVRLARTLTNEKIMARTGLSRRQIQRIIKASGLGEYAKK